MLGRRGAGARPARLTSRSSLASFLSALQSSTAALASLDANFLGRRKRFSQLPELPQGGLELPLRLVIGVSSLFRGQGAVCFLLLATLPVAQEGQRKNRHDDDNDCNDSETIHLERAS